MKTLQKRVETLYRFRCRRCRSKFEMTEAEKLENDWKFSSSPREKSRRPCNPLDKFDCPVCNSEQVVGSGEIHKYSVMDDGTEVMEY